MITIKKATEENFEALLQLIKEFSVFIKTPDKVSVTLEQMIRDKNSFNVWLLLTRIKSLGLQLTFSRIIRGLVNRFTWMTYM